MVYNTDYHTYQFCNGTIWQAFGGGVATGGLTLISTQTASNSASLQWTSIGSYTYYQLLCANLIPATAGTYMYLQFGEGGGPTWETANYVWVWYYVTEAGVGGSGALNGGVASAINLGGLVQNASPGFSLTATLNGLGSGGPKGVFFQSMDYNSGNYFENGTGHYTGDTNAITAIRIISSSGNITSGQCSLYGMN